MSDEVYAYTLAKNTYSAQPTNKMIAKVLLLIVSLASVANAFKPTLSHRVAAFRLHAADSSLDVNTEPAVPAPRKVAIPAQWFPFGVKAPLLLDGTLAADAGFDPLMLGSKVCQLLANILIINR